MDIIIFAVADFPDGFATAERIKLLSKALIEKGQNVKVCLIHPTRNDTGSRNKNVKGIYEDIYFEYMNGATVRPNNKIITVWDTIKGVVFSSFFLIRNIFGGDLKFVIFYTPNFFKVAPLVFISKIFRTPVIFEFCEIRSSGGSENKKGLLRVASSYGDSLSERLASHMASGIIAISRPIKNFFQNKGVGGERICLVPALAEFDKNQDGLEEIPDLKDKKYFLSSGSFGPKEGVETILSAFSIVAGAEKNVYLAFTGAPPERVKRKLQALIRELNLEGRILFLGYISRNELIWCYRNAVALLACRCFSPFAEYGFPTKFVEYLSAARPVIVTNVGDPHTYVEDGVNGFVAEHGSPESIADKMLEVLCLVDGGHEVGRRGEEMARKYFDFSHYGSRILELIK